MLDPLVYKRERVEEAMGITEEKKKEKEKEEFESRLRVAQAAHEEVVLVGKTVKGPTVKRHAHPESGAQEREELHQLISHLQD